MEGYGINEDATDPDDGYNDIYNCTDGAVNGFTSDASNLTSDPLLNADGSLTASSPAVNTGATAGTVSLTGSQTDAFGNTETFDTFFKMNIGADLTKFNTPSALKGTFLAGTYLPPAEEAETPTWIGGESITFIGGETFEWQ